MKTLIIPTDFSPAANNAARYAMHLAKEMKAHLLLCNAMLIPVESPMANQVVWPLETYDSLKKSVDEDLQYFAEELSSKEKEVSVPGSYHPIITTKSEIGEVVNVVRNLADEAKVGLAVMGMSGAGGLSRFFLGSKSRDMIEYAGFPTLLIPDEFVFNGIKKIAFATDLSVGDIETINSLAGLAKCFNAEILITHITDKKYDSGETKKMVDEFLTHVSNRVNYPKIYYRHVQSENVNRGLTWLTDHSMIDMLVMVHRPHDTLDKIFKGSHTQKLAKSVSIPLLVFPDKCCASL